MSNIIRLVYLRMGDAVVDISPKLQCITTDNYDGNELLWCFGRIEMWRTHIFSSCFWARLSLLLAMWSFCLYIQCKYRLVASQFVHAVGVSQRIYVLLFPFSNTAHHNNYLICVAKYALSIVTSRWASSKGWTSPRSNAFVDAVLICDVFNKSYLVNISCLRSLTGHTVMVIQ